MSEAMKTIQRACGVADDGAFGPNTARAMAEHYNWDAVRAAHILGQASHESANFTATKENLNYSASAILRCWPSRFKSEAEAKPYSHNPEKLAQKVYVDRMGNNTPERASTYIGRGFIQLTGYNNYSSFSKNYNRPEVMEDPSLLENELAMDSAVFFFNQNNLWSICDRGVNSETIKLLTKRINGGYNGLDDRKTQTNKIYGWLK